MLSLAAAGGAGARGGRGLDGERRRGGRVFRESSAGKSDRCLGVGAEPPHATRRRSRAARGGVRSEVRRRASATATALVRIPPHTGGVGILEIDALSASRSRAVHEERCGVAHRKAVSVIRATVTLARYVLGL